jgi:hypothetical protein
MCVRLFSGAEMSIVKNTAATRLVVYQEQSLGFAGSWSRQTSGNDRAFRILANPATLKFNADRPRVVSEV